MNMLALLTLGNFSHLGLSCYVCLYALGKDWARSAGWRGRKGAAERAAGTRLGSTSSNTSQVQALVGTSRQVGGKLLFGSLIFCWQQP